MRKVYDLPSTYGQHHIFLRHIPGTDRYILFQGKLLLIRQQFLTVLLESGAAKIIKEDPGAIEFDKSEAKSISFGLEGKLDSNGKVRGILFHPDYETNKRVFIYYMCDKNNPACVIQSSEPDCDFLVDGVKCCTPDCLSADGYYGHLSEFALDESGGSWTVSAELTRLRITFPDFYHAGGGMVFDGTGKLVLGVGDGSGKNTIRTNLSSKTRHWPLFLAQNDLRGFSQQESNIRGKV